MKANEEKSDKPINLQQGGGSTFSTHIFPETQFMGVTAYQNQQVRSGAVLCVLQQQTECSPLHRVLRTMCR